MFGKKRSSEEPLVATYSETEEGITIKVSGRLDSVSSGSFQTEAVSKCRGRNTVLDMTDVSYLSSSGLRAILSLDKAVGSGCKLSIVGASGAVKDVLDLSGFSDFL